MGESKGVSPVLLLRIPAPLLRALRRAAKQRKVTASALAREILEKTLERKGRPL